MRAFDVSTPALRNAQTAFEDLPGVTWELGDIQTLKLADESFDIVIAYGLLHCLKNEDAIIDALQKIQTATKPRGYNVICTFNDRLPQDKRAHPGFQPCLLSHAVYLAQYGAWTVVEASDADLLEAHPHNGIAHQHALTRFIACKTGA